MEAAAALADEGVLEAHSLADLAGSLGVRKPPLHNHVEGLSGLRRELALMGLREELGRSLSRAAAGKARAEGEGSSRSRRRTGPS